MWCGEERGSRGTREDFNVGLKTGEESWTKETQSQSSIVTMLKGTQLGTRARWINAVVPSLAHIVHGFVDDQ